MLWWLKRSGIWLALLAVIASLAGCASQSSASQSAIPVIASNAEYNDILADVEKISAPIFAKAESGGVVSQAELDQLRRASALFEGIIAYRPEGFAAYLGAARCYQLLGDHRRALDRFQACVERIRVPVTEEAVRKTLAEARFLASGSFLAVKDPEQALAQIELALEIAPANPNYLAGRALALLALDRRDEAVVAIEKALGASPDNWRALRVQELLVRKDSEPVPDTEKSP